MQDYDYEMKLAAAPDDKNAPSAPPAKVGASRAIALADGRLDSRELFVDTREITIAHGGEVYRLRLTAQNKLILTK